MLIPSLGPSPLSLPWCRSHARRSQRRRSVNTTPTCRCCPRARRPPGRAPEPAEVPSCTPTCAATDLRDLVPGARTVLLDGLADLVAARDYLARWVAVRPVPAERVGPLVELPTAYDGADLTTSPGAGDDTCRGRRHALRDRVHGRVRGVRAGLRLLQRPAAGARGTPAGPAPRQGAGRGGGAGGEYTGVYPTASPGGWRLVGRTDARLWDIDRDEPALLTPGTRVRFVEVSG